MPQQNAPLVLGIASRLLTVCLLVCLGLSLLHPAWANESDQFPVLSDSSNDSETLDLTGLTLDELYNLDIIQLNVLGGHTHPSGEIMVGYELMYSESSGYRDGTSELSDKEVLAMGFKNIHTEMTMEMHMLKLMYAPADNITLAAMINWKQMNMEHLESNGEKFDTESSGWSDLKLMALITLLGGIDEEGGRLLLNAGLSVPTGSVTQNDTVHGNLSRLEYRMQTGTGTWDPIVGLTYLDDSDDWSWGAQAIADLRFGRNSEGYRFGNHYRATAWGAYAVTDWFAPYLRMEGNYLGNIKGSDPKTNPLANPESVTNFQGGTEIDIILGSSFFTTEGPLEGNRFMIEFGVPVFQHLDGPQLSRQWFVRAGWSFSF